MLTDVTRTSELALAEMFDRGFPLQVMPGAAHACPRKVEAEISLLVEGKLDRVGAILFRGFDVHTLDGFRGFVRSVTPDLLTYEFGSTPRSEVAGRVYTSTEYPAHQTIPLHNEQSYTSEWPLKIWFYCAVPARDGGTTPLADSREVFRAIPDFIRKRFESKGVMYVRNYGNGLDVPWQKVFGTTDRHEVERVCSQMGIACEWKDDGCLRTRQICAAVAEHPSSRERVWFNQAHLFHVSNLEPSIRETLLAVVNEEELPRNACYGDGAPIEDEVLEEIRSIYDDCAVEFPWCVNDVLLLDNMLVAHGRTPFGGPRKVFVAMAESHSPAHGSQKLG